MKQIKLAGFSLLLMLAFLSCDVLNQVANFATCQYAFAGLGSPSIAGVSLNGKSGVDGLNAAALLKITTGVMSGNLPFSTAINVEATNPNGSAAQIEGLDWAIDLDNKNMLSGNVGNRVVVAANGGKTTIPFTIQVNLMEIFKGESKDNIVNFVNGLMNAGDASSKVSIRINPSVMVAGQKISTGFISLNKTVGAK